MEGVAAGYGFASASEFPLAAECDDINTMVHLVLHTDVLGVLPQAVAARSVKVLHRLPVNNVPTQYADVYAMWLKGRTLSPSARRAIALARQISEGVVLATPPGRSR